MTSQNAFPTYPLTGVRVLDMTVVWAGPYSAMFLADMGAEVIRVESTQRLNSTTRGQFAHPPKEVELRRPPGASGFPNSDPGDRPWNRGGIFNAHARNKYSMTVDLAKPEGMELFYQLVAKSDVLVENNSAGALPRLGISYEKLSAINPRFIMVSSAGMGQTGPWKGYKGWGTQFEALYGHSSVIGYPDMDVNGVPGSVVADATTGVTIAMATTMALIQREKTGKGMYLDVAQGETFVPHLAEYFMDYTINGRVGQTTGNRQQGMAQACFRCGGPDDDSWIVITIYTEEQWRTLCDIMGKPELKDDPRFSTMKALEANQDDFDQVVEAWTLTQDSFKLLPVLQAARIPSGPIIHEDEAYRDPQLEARGFFVPIDHPEIGVHRYPSTTFQMSKTPFIVRKPPIRLGEDNEYVYKQVLGVSDADYERLTAEGHIGMDYAPHVR